MNARTVKHGCSGTRGCHRLAANRGSDSHPQCALCSEKNPHCVAILSRTAVAKCGRARDATREVRARARGVRQRSATFRVALVAGGSRWLLPLLLLPLLLLLLGRGGGEVTADRAFLLPVVSSRPSAPTVRRHFPGGAEAIYLHHHHRLHLLHHHHHRHPSSSSWRIIRANLRLPSTSSHRR